jgi:subtilisin family serine protease
MRLRFLPFVCAAALIVPAGASGGGFSLVQAKPAAAFSLRAAGGSSIAPRLGIWRLPTAAAERLAPRLRRAGVLTRMQRERVFVSFARASAIASADPLPDSEWWLVSVGAAGLTTPGPGKPVVIVDSGLDATHPLFVGRPNLTLLNPQTTRGGEEDHGTEVGSVIGAGSAALGMVGVYPDAVLESWDASPFSLITDTEAVLGIEKATSLGPAVINLSWGSFESDSFVEQAVEAAYKGGSLVVAAVGNERGHGSSLAYPASYPHVLSVGATDENDAVTDFSSASPHLDLVAPGQDIVAADPQAAGGFSSVDGTSFAAPLVAGAAAWVWTARPSLDNTQLFQLLRSSATDLGPAGWDPDYGYGLLDLPAALAMPAPSSDPQEPNEDVDEVRPGGVFGTQANPVLRAGALSARVDAVDDPRDVYRIALPAGKRVTVRVSTPGLTLTIWGPRTTSVLEARSARKRDVLARGSLAAAARGTGNVGYVEVGLRPGTREASYKLTVSTR